MGAYALKPVAADAHLPSPSLFEPAKNPDNRADCSLDFTDMTSVKLTDQFINSISNRASSDHALSIPLIRQTFTLNRIARHM